MDTTERRLRVLFVAGCWYPRREAPTHGIFIRRHAEAAALHHEIMVLHPATAESGARLVKQDWVRHGRVTELHLRWRGRPGDDLGGWKSQTDYLKAGLTGSRLIRRRNGPPDLIHFHVVPSFGLALAVRASFPRTPMVLTEHWSGYFPESGERLSRLRRWYTGRLIRRARAVTTVSKAHREALRRLGFEGRYQVVPNVVDTDLFKPVIDRRAGPFRLVHVSGLKPVKRVPDLVEAFCRELDEGLACELHVVGDGPDRRAAEDVARQAGVLARQVVFHGLQDERGVARSLKSADGLVLFSAYENSPCVIAESLSCGLPVIAPAVGGIPEHLSPERGILIDPGDTDGLRSAIRTLVARPGVFRASELREYAQRTFSRATIGARFSTLYGQAVQRPGLSSRDSREA